MPLFRWKQHCSQIYWNLYIKNLSQSTVIFTYKFGYGARFPILNSGPLDHFKLEISINSVFVPQILDSLITLWHPTVGALFLYFGIPMVPPWAYEEFPALWKTRPSNLKVCIILNRESSLKIVWHYFELTCDIVFHLHHQNIAKSLDRDA